MVASTRLTPMRVRARTSRPAMGSRLVTSSRNAAISGGCVVVIALTVGAAKKTKQEAIFCLWITLGRSSLVPSSPVSFVYSSTKLSTAVALPAELRVLRKSHQAGRNCRLIASKRKAFPRQGGNRLGTIFAGLVQVGQSLDNLSVTH